MGATYTHTANFNIVFALRSTSNVKVTASTGALDTVIGSGFSTRWPFWFTQVPNGVVLMSNGIDPMQRWEAATGVMEVAGVPAPTVAPTLTISGTYSSAAVGAQIFAFVRFYDFYGNFSDLSPLGVSSSGLSTVTSVVYGGAPNFQSGVSTSVTIGPAVGVPKPSGPYALKVVGRQLLRNTPGEATVFYVDIDTKDLTSTTFTSYNADSTLINLTAVPLLTTTGALLANIHGFPPSWKAVTAAYLGRVFAASEVIYSVGNVVLTSQSTTVTGVGTQWPSNFAGRHLFISNPPGEYQIASVDPVAQTMTLSFAYQGPTDQFGIYGIRSPSSEWRLIYYTPSGQPESWPATYALSLQDDGDEITGLMQLGSFLYILEQQHIYRLTFLTDPAVDGAIFLSSRRGCLTQRLWVQAESTAYIFDQLGVHSFTGGASVPISDPIQDLWRDNSQSPLTINWDADTSLWSASYNPSHTTIRFFVAMTGSRYPYHALCYNYRQNRWWIEQYPRPVCSTTLMQVDGVYRMIAGMDANTVASLDVGYLDGTRGIKPTIGGFVTASSPCSLTDTSATFSTELLNLQVSITQGRAKGQSRRIVNVTDAAAATVTSAGVRLALLTPWSILPAAGDFYEVAAVPWQYQPGWFRIMDDAESNNARDIEVLFQPLNEGTADLQVFFNRSTTPRTWVSAREGTAEVVAGDPRVEIDLTDPSGRGIFRLEGHKERYLDGDVYLSPSLSGFQHEEPVRIYRISIIGVQQES